MPGIGALGGGTLGDPTTGSVLRKAAGTLAILVGVWILLVLFAVHKAMEARIEAEEFLVEAMKLEVGKSKLDQVVPLVSAYHGRWRRKAPYSGPPLAFDPSPCGPNSFAFEFAFDNRWLHWFLFSPRTTFVGTIEVANGIVCFRSMGFYAIFSNHAANSHVQEFESGRLRDAFSSQLTRVGTSVSLTAAATAAQRMRAYSFNLACLSSLQGCRNSKDLAPGIWENSHEVGPALWKSEWE